MIKTYLLLIFGLFVSASLSAQSNTFPNSGNVGIGTSRPDAKLTVYGTIHANEVKVDLNVVAPDYVFKADYKLKPLAQVQNYITANHHLPEIPSAATMKMDGVNLSEMNMKLLKKVEELTLYLMQMKDENQKQTKRINKLEILYKSVKHH